MRRRLPAGRLQSLPLPSQCRHRRAPGAAASFTPSPTNAIVPPTAISPTRRTLSCGSISAWISFGLNPNASPMRTATARRSPVIMVMVLTPLARRAARARDDVSRSLSATPTAPRTRASRPDRRRSRRHPEAYESRPDRETLPSSSPFDGSQPKSDHRHLVQRCQRSGSPSHHALRERQSTACCLTPERISNTAFGVSLDAGQSREESRFAPLERGNPRHFCASRRQCSGLSWLRKIAVQRGRRALRFTSVRDPYRDVL